MMDASVTLLAKWHAPYEADWIIDCTSWCICVTIMIDQ
jgi:hypothetical protein